MPAKIIFNWLIGIFLVISLSGFIMGLYSATSRFQMSEGKVLGKVGMWLFICGGIACIVCLAVRVTLGNVG